MKGTPTLLLVHGSWHGPWCWDYLVPELDRLGLPSRTVALPSCGTDPAALKGVPEDAAVVEQAAATIDSPVMVVAHSYGGVPVCQARFGANVKHLVFLGAFMPDTGRVYPSYLPPGPLPPFIEMRADGTFAVAEGHAPATFYADCLPERSAWASAQLVPQSQAVLAHPITRASWRDIESTYILLTEDHAVPTAIQSAFAPQATETITLPGSHSPFLAQPERLAAELARIARQIANGATAAFR